MAVADLVPLETLTDEELAVLAPAHSIVVDPFLDEQDAGVPRAVRAAVARTAYRSLVARGILEPPTSEAAVEALEQRLADDDIGTVAVMVRDDVRALVSLRQAARTVVAVARTTAASQDFWYAHVVDDVTLVEEVDSAGMHRFALSSTAALPELLVAAAVHPELPDLDTDQEGREVVLPVAPVDEADPTPPDEVLEELGAAVLRCDVVVRVVGDEEPVLFGVFSAPAGCWTLEAEYGTGGPLVARQCSGAEARRRLAGMVSGDHDRVTAP
ncbi:hypothetical protein EV189_0037 [Motilibacter rhizosphaerae]|uniref:ESAT-6 protein secretion system EspG family protein n=1 Tax=Motilibacter rhizosphaerae TaxID=598652 RepID=A0A4Q7NVB3_9ACTN|nr:hypothetical protein [Motilibacter rhizosphaerae]RZS90808.1 hypothetical protein EV189_0037 [Motilibacter rhizosphaerae]